MKKRTKIELVIFALVAILFILSLIRDMPGQPGPVPETTVSAHIELPSAPDITETESIEDTTAAVIETIQHTSPEESSEEAPPPSEPAETSQAPAEETETGSAAQTAQEISEDGTYTDHERVALYIHTYGHLPSNYVSKDEARDAGWGSENGNLAKVLPGMSIGGDYFGNYEGLLPKKKGRKYYECDVDNNVKKGNRGAKRIIYSNDGLIYYTKDHYESFELLYGEP